MTMLVAPASQMMRAFIRFATLTLLTVGSLSATASSQAQTRGSVQIINLMPSFWKFWANAKDMSAPQQLERWQSLYIRPNETVFHDLILPCVRHLGPTALEEEYFPALPGYVGGMRMLESSLPQTIAHTRVKFQKSFPDMAWHGNIYLMASAGCFNGRSQKIDGQESLLLGLDDIVGLHETDLPPLLEHELFHRYHHAFFAYEPDHNEQMWVRLWAEGMATYVSQNLSPSASYMDTMWMTDKKIADLDAGASTLAASFLRSFDSTNQTDADHYFLQDVSSDPRIPGHTGYYLGMRVAKLLNRHYSLATMAHWSRFEAEAHIREALQQIAAERPR